MMQAQRIRWPIVLSLSLLGLAMLACGGFQVRVTPTARPSPAAVTQVPPAARAGTAIATTEPVTLTTSVATTVPSATVTAAAGLAPGKSARITASGGLNVRDLASTAAKQTGKLDNGAVVTLTDGPVQANGYTWWKVDNGAGLTGWIAAGTATDPWIAAVQTANTPAAGGAKLVNRPVKLGDRVEVTTQDKLLTLRDAAGTGANAIARAKAGTQFIVRGGPVRQDGYLWWQLEGDQLKGWAAEGTEADRWLTPVQP